MRCKTISGLILVASLSIFADTGAAQRPPNPPAQSPPPAQGQQSGNSAGPGQRPMGGGAGGPSMMQMLGPMSRSQGPGGRGAGADGSLQRAFRVMASLDDPRMRTVLGLTDQQANGLRKIIVDTETFTITTGAAAAVDGIQLRELLRADKPDRAAVMSKGDEISKATSQMINHYLDAILAMKTILTPEQQKMIRGYIESGVPELSGPPGRP